MLDDFVLAIELTRQHGSHARPDVVGPPAHQDLNVEPKRYEHSAITH